MSPILKINNKILRTAAGKIGIDGQCCCTSGECSCGADDWETMWTDHGTFDGLNDGDGSCGSPALNCTYVITGYSDCDLTPPTGCADNIGGSWEGEFQCDEAQCRWVGGVRGLDSQDPRDEIFRFTNTLIVCGKTAPGTGSPTNPNIVLRLSGASWVLSVKCESVSTVFTIWSGVKLIGQTPAGDYFRTGGNDTTAVLSVG